MHNLFITGSDTDAGKTIVTAGLLRALVKAGIDAVAIKPVQTGCPDPTALTSDEALYRRALDGLPACLAPGGSTSRTATWLRYRRACSPHLAAAEEGRPIKLDDLAARYQAACAPGRVLLLEGAGGVLVPLGTHTSTRDLMLRLGLPILLVVPNRLGAIHQALSSLESLTVRGLTVLGIVLTRTAPPGVDDDPVLFADHAPTIARISGIPVLADIPWIADLAENDTSAWDQLATHLAPVAACLTSAHPQLSERSAPSDDVLRFDRNHLWHPYTSARTPLPCQHVIAAKGTRIRLADGSELVDGMASWWCAIHGYGHPHLLDALHRQADQMSHVMFGGLTHDPAVSLGRKLLDLLPKGLEHLFYADSGSVAVEVAMKMALQYRQARGEHERTLFLTPRGGYHGDTFGAMSVCDPINGMHGLFAGVLPQQIFIERPSCPFGAAWNPDATRELEAALEEYGTRCTAIMLEPIVQGAGGMWFYHPEYLRRVRALCDAHGLLLICDEIATGFGRTGRLFAVDWAEVRPDIMCVGKALTGGVITLSATAATRDVAYTISANDGLLMHGPTFMGNPLACAVAEASLELLSSTPWQAWVDRISTELAAGLAPCREHPAVADVRVLGAIGVVELHHAVDVAVLQDFFVDTCKVWIRPFGRLIYLMPPYVSTPDDIARLSSAVCRAVINFSRI